MNLKEYLAREGEKPLEHIPADGGYTAILRSITCIGDSLSSGEFEGRDALGNKTYHDMFEHSWGQYLARMAGVRVQNFSRGGMTAREYCDSFAEENRFWSPSLATNAYIIALGVNDLYNQNGVFGEISDICFEDCEKNGNTFIGYYAKIVQRIRRFRPDAKFFFMTMPRDNFPNQFLGDRHAEFLYALSQLVPNSYVIDLRKYGPEYDAEFRCNFYLGGHLSAAGYLLTARMVGAYIDYIIRHNMRDFKEVGFIGTPFASKTNEVSVKV